MTNGEDQVVKLPKNFKFNTKEVYIDKIGDIVILFPKKEDKFEIAKKLLMEIEDFTEEFMKNRETLSQKRDLF